ncbi:protein phosphatase regulator [Savitreella phatthalungensis]
MNGVRASGDLRGSAREDHTLDNANSYTNTYANANASADAHAYDQQRRYAHDQTEPSHAQTHVPIAAAQAHDDNDLDDDEDLDEEDEEDDEDMYSELSSSPSIPEGDIDFNFVYALHTFVATVEGQATTTKGDTLLLLDDTNSYWWLVRNLRDDTIGYLPAEQIETPEERLARANKHRNVEHGQLMVEELSAREQEQKSTTSSRSIFSKRSKSTKKRKVAVSFAKPTIVVYEALSSDDEQDVEQETDDQEIDSTAAVASHESNPEVVEEVAPVKQDTIHGSPRSLESDRTKRRSRDSQDSSPRPASASSAGHVHAESATLPAPVRAMRNSMLMDVDPAEADLIPDPLVRSASPTDVRILSHATRSPPASSSGVQHSPRPPSSGHQHHTAPVPLDAVEMERAGSFSVGVPQTTHIRSNDEVGGRRGSTHRALFVNTAGDTTRSAGTDGIVDATEDIYREQQRRGSAGLPAIYSDIASHAHSGSRHGSLSDEHPARLGPDGSGLMTAAPGSAIGVGSQRRGSTSSRRSSRGSISSPIRASFSHGAPPLVSAAGAGAATIKATTPKPLYRFDDDAFARHLLDKEASSWTSRTVRAQARLPVPASAPPLTRNPPPTSSLSVASKFAEIRAGLDTVQARLDRLLLDRLVVK